MNIKQSKEKKVRASRKKTFNKYKINAYQAKTFHLIFFFFIGTLREENEKSVHFIRFSSSI